MTRAARAPAVIYFFGASVRRAREHRPPAPHDAQRGLARASGQRSVISHIGSEARPIHALTAPTCAPVASCPWVARLPLATSASRQRAWQSSGQSARPTSCSSHTGRPARARRWPRARCRSNSAHAASQRRARCHVGRVARRSAAVAICRSSVPRAGWRDSNMLVQIWRCGATPHRRRRWRRHRWRR